MKLTNEEKTIMQCLILQRLNENKETMKDKDFSTLKIYYAKENEILEKILNKTGEKNGTE